MTLKQAITRRLKRLDPQALVKARHRRARLTMERWIERTFAEAAEEEQKGNHRLARSLRHLATLHRARLALNLTL